MMFAQQQVSCSADPCACREHSTDKYLLHELDIGKEQASEGVCWQIDEYRSNKKLDLDDENRVA
jgi:hypothetical protein